MNLSAIDWVIVVGYFALSMGIGLVFTKKGGESIEEYFLSGRNVSWWLAGASMVATTFAADTPLVVTGLVFANGVAGNWLWWNMLMSGMLTVFFFARLWRRAGVMTDVEFAELRYSGKPAAALRGFRAVYLALPINLIILGWVTKAMIKILTISLGLRDVNVLGFAVSGEVLAVGICFLITVAYSTGAGMWAVLWTDLVQFVIKMSAVIILAVYAVRAVGGMDKLKEGLATHYGSSDAAISILPVHMTPSGISGYAWMPLLTLAVFLSVQWWAAWYPGAEPGGGGYVAQRIFSSKTERDGVLATLFFQVAHYAIRPWPWIITGLATVLLYPAGIGPTGDHEAAYVQAYVDLLPTPWRGFMMAGFAAAYMSTVGTQLNWGASYLVNDFYKRFVLPAAVRRRAPGRPLAQGLAALGVLLLVIAYVGARQFDFIQRHNIYLLLPAILLLVMSVVWTVALKASAGGEPGEGHYVKISRWSTVFLFLASIFVTWQLDTVASAWELLLALGSGTGLVLILRWYWSRINAWSEISAMIASFVVSLIAMSMVKSRLPAGSPLVQTYVMLITVAVSTVVWLTVTFLTKPEPDAKLDAFYEKVRPGGPGWRRVSERLGYGGETIPGGALAWTNWLAGIVAVYASLFGIGKLIFGETMTGVIMLIVAALAFAWIARAFREEDKGERAQAANVRLAAAEAERGG